MGFVEERSVTWPEVVKEETVLANLFQWDLSFRDTWDGERCRSKILTNSTHRDNGKSVAPCGF